MGLNVYRHIPRSMRDCCQAVLSPSHVRPFTPQWLVPIAHVRPNAQVHPLPLSAFISNYYLYVIPSLPPFVLKPTSPLLDASLC